MHSRHKREMAHPRLPVCYSGGYLGSFVKNRAGPKAHDTLLPEAKTGRADKKRKESGRGSGTPGNAVVKLLYRRTHGKTYTAD